MTNNAAMTMALGALLASACSASPPPGGPRAGEVPPGADSASGQPDQHVPAHRRSVTAADNGTFLRMQLGQVRRLRTSDPRAPEPRIDGLALEVVGVDNEQATIGRRWELRAVRTGRSRIVVVGNDPFVVTIDVTPP